MYLIKSILNYITSIFMNIHEHQAKELLSEFGAPVSRGIVIYNLSDIDKKIDKLKSKKFVLKAQIHAGGRGKAGGVKLVNNVEELKKEAKILLGKKLVTPQTGSKEEKYIGYMSKKHQKLKKSIIYHV